MMPAAMAPPRPRASASEAAEVKQTMAAATTSIGVFICLLLCIPEAVGIKYAGAHCIRITPRRRARYGPPSQP